MSDWAERMTNIMRQQGAALNGPAIQLAVMTGPTSLSIGNLALDQDDLVFSEHLLQPICVGEHDVEDYLPALTVGDTVAVLQMSDARFWVIEKVVSV